jgi:hypothetical protein
MRKTRWLGHKDSRWSGAPNRYGGIKKTPPDLPPDHLLDRRFARMMGGMDLAAFKTSLSLEQPPEGLGLAARALWWDGKGDWAKAHECAQEQDDRDGAWVHAYLHRKEGDGANAAYWYRRAGKPAAGESLAREWEAIVRALLAR